jgi:peptidylprolyl isomerase
MTSSFLRKAIVGLACLIALSFVAANAQTKRHTKTKPKPRTATTVPKPSGAAITTPTGLTYLITHHGTGALAQNGDTVTVHYTGTLTNGVKFDSSRDRGEPISFKLGQGRVIKGWDQGLAQLHVGDQAILVIPPQLAYGERGAGEGLIPANATLIFIVELVDAKK